MTPNSPRRRVKFKQRTPRSTRGNGRRTQRMLVAALLAVGLGAPATLLVRAVVRDGLTDPAGIARRLRGHAPENEPLLRLPDAVPAVAAAPARAAAAARPAVGWSTPAPDAPVARSWEAPFAGGRNVAVAPVIVPTVRTAPNNTRDAGFAPLPAVGVPVRNASTSTPVGLHGLAAPALAGLVASTTQTIAPAAGESAPVRAPSAEVGAALRPGPRPHAAAVVVPTNPFIWSGVAAAGSTPNPNWTINNNWLGNTAPNPNPTPGFAADVIYAPTSLATATNVNVDYTINSLTFQGPVAGASPSVDTPSFNVTGNGSQGGTSDLLVGAGGITNASANAQTLSLPVYAIANQTFTVSNAAGQLNLPGPTPAPSQFETPIALYLQGSGRTVTVDGAGTTNISGVVAEGGPAAAAQIIKNGTGTLILAGSNLYTGGTTLNAGTIDARNDNAFGAGTLTINGGGVTSGNFAAVNNPVTVNADFAHTTGDTYLSLNGPVALGAASRTITSTDANQHSLAFGGVISGAPGVGLTLVGSSAIQNSYFYVFGAAANTYSGPTVVDHAELDLVKDNGAVAIPGDLTVRNNASVFTAGGQLAATTNLTVNSGGQFDASGGNNSSANETFNTLNGDSTGTVSFGNYTALTTLTVNSGNMAGLLQDGFLNSAGRSAPSSARDNGVITAAAPFGTINGALNKVSNGTLTLSHNNTYSGGTLVAAGALFANNAPTNNTDSATGSGDVLVFDGARLGGSGSVGRPAVSGEGTIPGSDTTIGGSPVVLTRPGLSLAPTVTNPAIIGAGATLNSTAILTVNGNLTLTSTALLEAELGGTTAGTGYDQIVVLGAIALGGDLSLATLNGFALTVGDTFYILDGQSDATIIGTFANVTPDPESLTGTYTDANGNIFRVNYADSDPSDPTETTGNDLSVTVLAIPEPGSLALATAGVLTGLGAWLRRRRAV